MSARPGLALLLVLTLLAGCLDMFLNDDEDTSRTTPAVSWAPDENADRLSVVTAAHSADWTRLTFEVKSCSVAPPAALTIVAGAEATSHIRYNVDATSSGAPLNQHRSGASCGPAAPKTFGEVPQRMAAGDFVAFCTTPTPSSSQATLVELVVRDVEANAIMLVHRFDAIAPC